MHNGIADKESLRKHGMSLYDAAAQHETEGVPMSVAYKSRSKLAVALQGGGSYGAFEWGILDALLEHGIAPMAMSGASAGAMNAVTAAFGYMEGGCEGARHALDALWSEVGVFASFSPMNLPGADLHFDLLTSMLSPYQFNPLNLNPLRDLLVRLIDFDRLRRYGGMPLFISATNVNTGDARIFREHEISVDVLAASACLPTLHHTVVIDGVSYWDGGLSANPPVLPLAEETDCTDLLVVRVLPDQEDKVPMMKSQITTRLRRILLNTPTRREVASLRDMQTMLDRCGCLPPDLERLRHLGIHELPIPAELIEGNSGLDPRPEFITSLKEAGRQMVETTYSLEPGLALFR
jgi:NTE family protein